MPEVKWLCALLICLATPVLAQPDRTLAFGADPLQQMDLYLPDDASAAPVIVMLHGGAWLFGDKGHRAVWQAKSEYWLPQGYAFISVNTRLLPEADPLEQADDLAAALAFVQNKGPDFGIDPDRIIVMGHSAGAHVAALVATNQEIQSRAGLSAWRGTIALDTAALDLESLMAGNPARLHRRAFGTDPGYWRAASPLTHLGQDDGPFLIVCSLQRTEPCPAATLFARQAASSGVLVDVLPKDLSHRQINTLLGRNSAYTAAVDEWIAKRLR